MATSRDDYPVVVQATDLRHVLDVFIDNGMVEAEDEAIVNRLWEACREVDPMPQSTDGPEYHADLAAWKVRNGTE